MSSQAPQSAGSRIAWILGGFVALIVIPATIAYWQSLREEGDAIVATVNGSPIFERDLAFAREEVGGALNEMDASSARSALIDFLIERRVLALKGREERLTGDPEVKARLAYYEDKAIREVYYGRKVRAAVSERDIQAFYDANVATMKPLEEIRASHILLDSKSEANRIYKEVIAGADFAEMAKKNSVGPSAPNGGDIGFFTQGEVVESFGTAAFAMQPGEISKPVQSDFGWHIIKVVERRLQPPLSLEQVAPQIRGIKEYEKGQALIAELKEAADIQIVSQAEEVSVPAESPPAESVPAEPAASETAPE